MQEDLLRREGQVDIRLRQCLPHAREHAVLRIQCVRRLRPGPPARTQVDREASKRHEDDVGLQIRRNILCLPQRLQDDAPCFLDVVAIRDTDVVFPAALRAHRGRDRGPASEEVLEPVLEGEADRDATNAHRADEIRRREARERGRCTDEKPEDHDAHLREPADGQLQRASLAAADRACTLTGA